MDVPIQGRQVADLLREAQRGTRRLMSEVPVLRDEPGAATWEPNARRALGDVATPAVETSAPVAIYSLKGNTKWHGLGWGKGRETEVDVPVVVGGGEPTLVTSWEQRAGDDLVAKLDAGARQAIDAAADIQDPNARGLFLVADGDTRRLELRTLEIATPRGMLPLRLDGLTQVLTGARQFVEGQGVPPVRGYLTRAHEALVGVVDNTGGTKGYYDQGILAIAP